MFGVVRRREPFNFTPMGVNSISSGPPHVLTSHMGVHRTCSEPDEIKKNTHPKYINAHVVGRAKACEAGSKQTVKPTDKVNRECAACGPGLFADKAGLSGCVAVHCTALSQLGDVVAVGGGGGGGGVRVCVFVCVCAG